MSLVKDGFFEPCVLMEKRRVLDSRGSLVTQWTEGEEFQAAITYNTSVQGKVAEAQGVKDLVLVTTETLELDFHDVFKRVSDGQVYRVTTNPKNRKPPRTASNAIKDLRQINAEEWTLTGD